jgi:hypothetical protein
MERKKRKGKKKWFSDRAANLGKIGSYAARGTMLSSNK